MKLFCSFALVFVLLGLTSCGGTAAPSTAVACTTTTPTTTTSTSTATATNTCTDPTTGISVTISPATASVNLVSTYRIFAQVSGGTNSVVTWQVNGVAGGNSTVGQIDSSGLYTAPAKIPSPATVNVTAVSYEDSAVSATAAITITPAPTVAINTPAPGVKATAGASSSNAVNFTATETGGTTNVILWEVGPAGGLGVLGGNAAVGTISASGVYIPPVTPPIGQTVVVTAVAQDYPTSTASLAVTISGYSKSSFQGQFAFTLAGSNTSGPFFRAGSFVADGAGNLNSGLEDVNDSLGVTTFPISFVGSYTLGADGRGTLTFTDNRATTPAKFDFVLVNGSQLQIIGFDGSGTSSGQANLQDPSKFNVGLSGTYVFDFKGVQGSATLSQIGEFTVDGLGNITSGLMDVNSGGAIASAVPITRGTYSVPVNSSGRGTATLVTSNGTLDFSFYMISQGSAKFVGTDTTEQASGAISQQAPNGAFGQTSLNGNYAFLLAGSASGGAIATAGSFFADGNGHFTSGVVDENSNVGPIPSLPFQPNGTYTVTSNGRGTATFATATRTYTLVFYLGPGGTNPSAVLQETDSGADSDGIFAQQQNTPFTLASIQGNYAIATSGSSGTSGQDTIGQFGANGSGVLSAGAIDINTGGILTSGETVSGTYTTPATNGRSAIVLNPAADNRNFAAYVVSSTQVFILGIDPGRVGVGALFRQF